MSGKILELARRDAKNYVKSGGFEETISLSNPDGSASISLTGFATKHHINFDSDGLPSCC